MKKIALLFVTLFVPLFVLACAAGPRDVLDANGGSADASAPPTPSASGYAYAARRPLVAIGLADSMGFSESDTHAVIDHVADVASACFKKSSTLHAGAVRVTLPVDSDGLAGSPAVTFSPPESGALGLICIVAPLRLMTFSPAESDAGARSITIESAWGP